MPDTQDTLASLGPGRIFSRSGELTYEDTGGRRQSLVSHTPIEKGTRT